MEKIDGKADAVFLKEEDEPIYYDPWLINAGTQITVTKISLERQNWGEDMSVWVC